MRWQPGGNLEPARIICETDWRQCPKAILRYVWTEVVTDVVDCLSTEETIWRIIAVIIVLAILLRMVYIKRKCSIQPTLSKDTLKRVGCKVEDLELKINILTYKLQYGTWPLPHQIRKPALKKQLRNVRLTLSTSSDRNAWIKHMLLSSTSDVSRLSQPKLDLTSIQRMTELLDGKTGYVSSEIHRDMAPTEYSDARSSKTTSAESLKKNYEEGIEQRGQSKSENLRNLRRNETQLSLLLQRDNVVGLPKQKRSKFSTSQPGHTPCDRYTESLHECKRFLRELKESNKMLELECSSATELNNDSLGKEIFVDQKLSLHAQTADAKKASGRCEFVEGIEGKTTVQVEQEEKNLKRIEGREIISNTSNEISHTRGICNGLTPSLYSNVRDNLTINFPIEDSKNIQRSDKVLDVSQETLYRIKQKLESLDNVLRAYGMLNSRTRDKEEISNENGNDIRTICRNVSDTLDTIKVEIDNINESRNNRTCLDASTKEYSDKMLQTTDTDDESTKFEDTSSIPVKNETQQRIVASNKNSLTTIVERDQPAEETTKIDTTFTQPTCNRDLIMDHEHASNDSKNQEELEASRETRTYVKTLSDSSTRRITLTKRNLDKLSELPSEAETDEDRSIGSATSSQQDTSKESDVEDKSTVMLLREALQCKKELLSRVKLQKFYSNIEFGHRDESYKDNFKNDNDGYLDGERNFQSKLLDIIAEERSTSTCTDKTSKTYIFVRMKQPGETSDRSGSSVNIDVNDKGQENTSKPDNFRLGVRKLSKQMIPAVSSRYFSFNDFPADNDNAKVVLKEVPNEDRVSLDGKESIDNSNTLCGKRRFGELATKEDEEVDSDRKRPCQWENDAEDSTYLRSPEENNVQDPYRVSNAKDNDEPVLQTKDSFHEPLRENMKSITDFVKSFSKHRKTQILEKERQFEETDDFFWNPTTESSSGSFVRPFVIDNGSMTNFLSNASSNVEMIKYPTITEEDNEDMLHGHDLSLKRRPGTFSFAHLRMNTVISKDSDLFIRNPYFLAGTSLSEATRRETIEVNLIPISMSTAIIDSGESSLCPMTRSKAFRDIANVSSTLRICYDDDIDCGNITEITEHEGMSDDDNEVRPVPITRNDDDPGVRDDNVVCLEDKTKSQNLEEKEESRYNETRSSIREFQDGQAEVIDSTDINDEGLTKSQSNVISQQSSSYFTGDTSSSTNKLESCRISNSNVDVDHNLNEIDIRKDILEFCIDSCVNLLTNKRSNTEDVPSRLGNPIPIESASKNDDASDRTSDSYIDAKISQTCDDINKSKKVSNIEESQKSSEGLFFDGSIKYKKPSILQSTAQSPKKSPQINTNPIKSKTPKVEIKSKSTISVERTSHSRKPSTNNSQLRAKSNSSIIDDSKKDPSTCYTSKASARPSSCNLSREKSRSYVISRRSESSTRSIDTSQSEDHSRGEELTNKSDKNVYGDKPKSRTHSKHSLASTKSFSKSCIPILKSRLDARRTELTSRPKSPRRGPLTITGVCRTKEDANGRNVEAVTPMEGGIVRKERFRERLHEDSRKQETTDEEKSRNVRLLTESRNENANVIGKNCESFGPREQTVIYVNIVQPHECNVTRILDPEKFLEYAKGESIPQNVNDSDFKLQSGMLPKIVTIVSSVSNKSDVNRNSDNSSSNLHISTGTLQSLWSVTIQQKEIEVTAKPSVADTGTSISDLQERTEMMQSQEQRIFGIPKELTNEEYSYLLQILTQKTNLAHLKEIENLCNGLRQRNENSG